MNEDSITHTKWNCKYHIVFTPKFRRKAIYGQLKADIGKILRELCTWKGVEIIEATAMPDHIISTPFHVHNSLNIFPMSAFN